MSAIVQRPADALADDPAKAGRVLHVIFKVGGAEYMLPADEILQMESFTGATPVPGAAPFVAGLVQIRGRVIPVVDLRLRFGLPPGERTLDSRVIVGQRADRIVGLLVDVAREVVPVAPGDLEPPAPIIGRQSNGFVKAIAKLGPRLVMLVDFAKVIGEEQLDVSA